ncbi:MAG: hypothetical protein JWP97_2497 [Labilithrix sp.]|nr:hypothetical protein [Labilithrix sp.]
MGKIDEMRRVREEAFAAAERRASKAPKPAAPAASAPAAPSAEPARAEPARAAPAAAKKAGKAAAEPGADGELAKCPECGKMKPLANGVMGSHQKGFGKNCPGSRKKPA